MPNFRVVHVSDLHVRESWRDDQKKVVAAFLRDLATIHLERAVDLVVFTGDLAFSGKHEEYLAAQAILLDPLEKVTRLGRDRIILAPGNHDIDRTKISSIFEEGLSSTLVSRERVSSLIRNSEDLDQATRRLSGWQEFHQSFYAGVDTCPVAGGLGVVHRVVVQGVSVGVAALCSSWRASGGPDDVDRAKLLIGELQITDAIDEMQDVDRRIFAFHHPMDWLADFDRRDAQRELARACDLLLTGHVHLTDGLAFANRTGTYLHSAAGSLYQDRAHLNSYTIIDFATDRQVQFSFRTYFEGRDEFGVGEDTAPGGTVAYEISSPTPAALRNSTAADMARSALDKFAKDLTPLPDNFHGESATEILTEPILLPLPLKQYAAAFDPSSGKRLARPDLDEDLGSGDVIILAGEESSGLTGSLTWIVSVASKRKPEQAPLVIDFRELGATKDPVDREVRRQLRDSGFDIHPSSESDPLPPYAIAIDNFDPSSADKRRNRVVAHLGAHPSDTRLVGCRPHQAAEIADLLSAAGISHRTRHLGRMGRKQIREVSTRFDHVSGDALAEAALSLFEKERIPKTPFMVVAVIEILADQGGTALTGSETDVLAAYVDRQLGRNDSAEDQRYDFDFRNRQHLLSRFAFALLERGVFEMSRVDTELYFLQYLKERQLEQPVSTLVDDFVDRKIFWERKGQIGFRQPAILYFMAATMVIEDSAAREIILRDPMSYGATVRHAAALKRDDAEILSAAVKVLTDAIASQSVSSTFFASETPTVAFSEIDENALALKLREPGDQSNGHLISKPFGHAHDPEFDHILDALDNYSEAEESEGNARPKAPTQQLLDVATFCGSVLRNSELVSSPELKAQAIVLALRSFSDAAASVWSDGTLDSLEPVVKSIVTAMSLDESNIDRILVAFRWQFPTLFSGMEMTKWLASPKLLPSLRSCLDDSDFMADPGCALMACVLWSSSSGAKPVEEFSKLLDRHADVPAIAYAVRFFAFLLYYAGSSPHAERVALEKLIVQSLTAGIEYPTKAARERHRSRILENARLQVKIARTKESIDGSDFL